LSAEEKWCIFLRYRHEQQAKLLIDELCEKEEGIMRAAKQVNFISRDFLKYLREMDEIKNELEQYDKEQAILRKGHAEVFDLLSQGLSIEEIKQRLKKGTNP